MYLVSISSNHKVPRRSHQDRESTQFEINEIKAVGEDEKKGKEREREEKISLKIDLQNH